ncbi:hypothetical protein Gmet_3451 [Geobacter metallireducens GS-15]|uniref:Uncharacterized protein n=1 Tax=Geobacter metallireducens (strain ATCC 53774 / DSM 7210 / GS-15) TaxID=269799 RepID=Q39Q14_GEOMG|nr:hypothetical protein Gmet_3451 [Geobacter metallireducens GS-15]
MIPANLSNIFFILANRMNLSAIQESGTVQCRLKSPEKSDFFIIRQAAPQNHWTQKAAVGEPAENSFGVVAREWHSKFAPFSPAD